MTVRRIQGSEVEYGIVTDTAQPMNPMVASTHVVNSYAAAHGLTRRPRWDYEDEAPLRDARGFDLSRAAADPSQLTDEDVTLANVVLTNGARLYVDHAHPEYATPEVTDPLDIVRFEKAGERIMAAGAEFAERSTGATFTLYKNNVDNKGASYGSHENYLMNRDVEFTAIVRGLTPFFVTRPVMCGAGRVGRGADGSTPGFQLSQRADYIEEEVGLETTLRRPIINTRDEPHADPKLYRRLHVIIGDANMSELAIFLKHATTSLVIAMIEAGEPPAVSALADPVAALHTISHDPGLGATVELSDGRSLRALDIQWLYYEAAEEFFSAADPATSHALQEWHRVLNRLDSDPMSLANELDWVAKLNVMEQYRRRDGLDWDAPKLQLIDLQYHDLRPTRGIYHKLVASGRVKTLVAESAIEAARTEPPWDTRAYFRGTCLAEYGDHVAAASWDSVIFDVPGQSSLQRVPTLDPFKGTKAHVRALFDSTDTVDELLARISSP